MDSNSSASGEKLNIKTRKPYTITKQRERWTEDEHNSFLEALKLYGRAWQRIEEHIGTKTAVQIRSHAQKFFTKLEKEAVAKGIPIGQAIDMEIPPPRPKRKPNYPYPRKIDPKTHTQLAQKDDKQTTLVSSLQSLDLDREPLTEGVQTCPRHVPVQVVDANQGITAKTSVAPETSFQESEANNSREVYEHPNPNVSAASATSGHRNSATFHPLVKQFSDTQESYSSFLHGLIVSSLLQNPAAHAAASVAAKFWHPMHTEASSAGYFSRDQSNNETTTPSTTAIVAATVAAATAWWSAHGLLPVCAPFYQGGYFCTSGAPIDENLANNGRDKAPSEGVLQEEKMDAEKTESAADLSSSEDSGKKLNSEVTPVDTNETALVVDLNKLENLGKQVDRSSCGSNTTSSSEIEMTVSEKHGKDNEKTKASDVKESISRRGRSTVNPNESWKEVSNEGRLAFQALFSKEVLPQSFSDTHTVAKKDQQNMINNSELDLNRMSQEPVESTGLGSVKLNHRRTGFKPYKRCSIEAKESNKIVSAAASTCNENDKKGPKRMRLETEALT